MTLSKALLPSASLLSKSLLVLGGTALIAAASQVQVPMIPVPMTLQTLAVLLVGLTLGARMGAATLIAYLAEGAAGLPVFAGGANGAVMFGPTAGFLFGFVAMAWIVGLAADRGIRGFLPTVLVSLLASAALYLPGLAWPAAAMGVSLDTLLGGWALPFLAGDVVKAVLAALIVSGGWAAVKGRKA